MTLKQKGESLSAPGRASMEIVKSDTVDLAVFPKSLWINTDGVIRGILESDYLEDNTPGPARNYVVTAGSPLPLVFRRIFTTETTADFVAIRL